ncbi:PP2C family protein-serine/threonine phosphatase [Nevskia soli]|uniref:PP2C family protein-serine/threonine phosphatase n=1 Tax=Nevskia soli TaxID=418856 RepID=UPI0012FBB42B|nr:protein phosphatase 2C domain-containing protein [Nevskia soli]
MAVDLPKPSLELTIGSAQLQGSRFRQEDAFITQWVYEDLIVLVADGLGGHTAGDEASRIGINIASASLASWLKGRDHKSVEARRILKKAVDAGTALRNAFIETHESLLALRPLSGRRGSNEPATTLVGGVFLIDQRQFVAASVGDSSLYLLREGALRRLFRPERGGGIDFAAGSSIGARGRGIYLLEPPLDLMPEDRLLLATDGLDVLDEHEIGRCLNAGSPRETCEALIKSVIELMDDEQDNCTIVVVYATEWSVVQHSNGDFGEVRTISARAKSCQRSTITTPVPGK